MLCKINLIHYTLGRACITSPVCRDSQNISVATVLNPLPKTNLPPNFLSVSDLLDCSPLVYQRHEPPTLTPSNLHPLQPLAGDIVHSTHADSKSISPLFSYSLVTFTHHLELLRISFYVPHPSPTPPRLLPAASPPPSCARPLPRNAEQSFYSAATHTRSASARPLPLSSTPATRAMLTCGTFLLPLPTPLA